MRILHQKLQGKDPHEAGLSLLKELCGGILPEIARTRLGKPYFVNDSRHFSISHTPRHVFCVVSEKTVGIDAEELDREIKLSLAEKLLSPKEYAQFQQAKDKNKALLTFWVLKEAAGKCAGTGMQLWPDDTDFSLGDPRVQELGGCLVAVIEQE